jgi:hypothetical protein
VGIGIGLLGSKRNPSNVGNRRHTINSMFSPYHAVHGNPKAKAWVWMGTGSRILAVAGIRAGAVKCGRRSEALVNEKCD